MKAEGIIVVGSAALLADILDVDVKLELDAPDIVAG